MTTRPSSPPLPPDARVMPEEVAGTFTADATGTGAWADSTHSPVWMTHGGHAGSFDVVRGPRRRHIADLAITAVLVSLATSNLIDVYGSATVWAMAAVPAVALGCLIALAGTIQAMRLWWQLVFLVSAQFVVGPIMTLNGTTIGHVIPTARTLALGWQGTFGSFKLLIAVDPPIGTSDGSLMAVWAIALWAAFITGTLVLTDQGLPDLAATLVVCATFAGTALLGTATGWRRIVCGVIAALLLVVWMSVRHGSFEPGRRPSALLIVLLATGLAVGACLVVPQDRTILRDSYDPPLSPHDYTSPLSGMRAYLKEHKDDIVLTVRDLPAGTPVRLAVMDRFDGNVWNLSDSSDASGSSDYRRVVGSIAGTTKGDAFTATFTVGEGFSDVWLPSAGSARRISAIDGPVYYNADTDSSLYPDGVSKGLTYTEQGVLPRVPSDKEIDDATAARMDQPETVDSPDAADKLATALAGGQGKGGAAARRLADALKESGWFSHGLTGDYPSLPGHGNHRIGQLLGGTEMVGDSEQYASAMALMARDLGLPSRVVLGFIPKDGSGAISDARTIRRGRHTVIAFTGNDIEAWVEIKLHGYGWVAFHPTPQETKLPDKNRNLTPPNPQTLVRQPPVPLQDPLRDDLQIHGRSSLSGQMADDNGTNLFWTHVGRVAARVALYGSPLWTAIILCAAILSIKAVHLARARRRGAPRVRVASAWRSLTDLARQSGVDVHGTRRDEAKAMAVQLHIAESDLTMLYRDADHAAFSGDDIDDDKAGRYWSDVDVMRRTMLASMPRLRRWRTRLSLAGMFTRNGGKRQWKSPAGIVADMCARFVGHTGGARRRRQTGRPSAPQTRDAASGMQGTPAKGKRS